MASSRRSLKARAWIVNCKHGDARATHRTYRARNRLALAARIEREPGKERTRGTLRTWTIGDWDARELRERVLLFAYVDLKCCLNKARTK